MTVIPRPPQAVVFDLDGTLLDSAEDIARSVNTILSEHRRPALSLEQVKLYVGDGAPVLIGRAFQNTGDALPSDQIPPLVAQYTELLGAQPPDPRSVYPGVREALERLSALGVPLAVCSNKPERGAYKVLNDLDLTRFFDVIVGGDTLPYRKPDGRALLWVLDRLEVNPDNAIMVGDSPPDIETGRSAGTAVVAVSYGYARMPVAELGADMVIDRMTGLLKLFNA